MIFQFQHANNLCTAYVIYNAFQIRDTMVVEFIDHTDELGKSITFEHIKGKGWQTDSTIKTKFESTYKSICKALQSLFSDHNFEFC